MGTLIPNEPLVYERVAGVVYARYTNKPDIPRWIVGGYAEDVSRAQGDLFSYSDWQDMMRIAKSNETLAHQMKKMLDIYYIVKDSK